MVPMPEPGPLESLQSAWAAYTNAPVSGSPQQHSAIEAIDSAIDALNAAHVATTSIERHFGGGGIPDIYLDSHFNQLSDLLACFPLTLPFALRQAWNLHLAGHEDAESVTPLVQQAQGALAEAGWFLDSAQHSLFDDWADDPEVSHDLQSLDFALQPRSALPVLSVL